MHIFNPKDFQKLLSPERHSIINPVTTLTQIGLKEGDTFLDFGCGPGFFTVPASNIVKSSGKIFALDIFDEMLQELAKSELKAPTEFVKLFDSTIPLVDEVANIVFMAFVLHEVIDKEKVLSELYRVTMPKGKIAVIEWNEIHAGKGPDLGERVSSKEAIKVLENAGFKDIIYKEINPYHYLVVGSK